MLVLHLCWCCPSAFPALLVSSCLHWGCWLLVEVCVVQGSGSALLFVASRSTSG